jgi:hypothetical protein
MVRSGSIPHIQLPCGEVRFDRHVLEQWIEKLSSRTAHDERARIFPMILNKKGEIAMRRAARVELGDPQ